MTLIKFIRRFGFWRGLEFRRLAAKCDKNPEALSTWASYFQAKASAEFRHDNNADGRVYLAFAEMLRTTRDRLVLLRKPRRPILTRQQRRIERALKKMQAQKRSLA